MPVESGLIIDGFHCLSLKCVVLAGVFWSPPTNNNEGTWTARERDITIINHQTVNMGKISLMVCIYMFCRYCDRERSPMLERIFGWCPDQLSGFAHLAASRRLNLCFRWIGSHWDPWNTGGLGLQKNWPRKSAMLWLGDPGGYVKSGPWCLVSSQSQPNSPGQRGENLKIF